MGDPRWTALVALLLTAAEAGPDSSEDPSREFHNLFVLIVLTLLLLWTGKVSYQLYRALDLHTRLMRSQSLQLEGMSVYARDFQMLIRQHFNQILRIRRTVPAKLVMRQELLAHLHPDSIGCVWVGEEESCGGPLGFGVEFTIDTQVPCCVRLYWGVSVQACNDFVQQRHSQGSEAPGRRTTGSGMCKGLRGRWGARSSCANPETTRSLLELEDLSTSTAMSSGAIASGASSATGADEKQLFLPGQFVAHSRDFFLPAGRGQRYVTPAGDLVDPGKLQFDVGASWLREGQAQADQSAVVPLAIVIMAVQRSPVSVHEVQGRPVTEIGGQISFVRFQRRPHRGTGDARPPGPSPASTAPFHSPEVVRQLCFGDSPAAAFEVQGVFGFEDPGDEDCMICYARPKNVLLLPCRHCSVCHPCLRSLRDEKCPLCRSSYSSYLTLPISRTAGRTSPSQAASGPAAGDIEMGSTRTHAEGQALMQAEASPYDEREVHPEAADDSLPLAGSSLPEADAAAGAAAAVARAAALALGRRPRSQASGTWTSVQGQEDDAVR
eukprot:TRINITY_DN11316_c0_g1_i2.p1 TRINITY_DN11316_c0_g1~~TRINITY_DN11316_c0_g1_i2.p1  ORF type:complete len:551 (+),score=94.52 TRINITY_DN11316_c0_g1_i2:40-1692(+)